MNRRKIIACGTVLAVGYLVFTVSSASGDGAGPGDDTSTAAWSAHCLFTENAQVDPIMDYGQTSMHMHTFSGEPGYVSSTMKPDQLRTAPAGTTTCDSPTIPVGGQPTLIPDQSAYWAPTLYLDSGPSQASSIVPYSVRVYYRNEGVDPDTMVAFPEALSFVGGNQDATSDQPASVIRWSCDAQKPGDGTTHEVNFGAEIPASCPVYDAHGDPYHLRLVVYFPQLHLHGGDPRQDNAPVQPELYGVRGVKRPGKVGVPA